MTPETAAEVADCPSSAADPHQTHLEALATDLETAEAETMAETEAAPAGEVGGVPVDGQGFVTRGAFPEYWGQGLRLAGLMSGLETLRGSPDQPTWPEAAGAIYDTLRDMPSLHFLIRPGGKWMQRAALVAIWGLPVATGCVAELRARKSPKAGRPANDDGPPLETGPVHDAAETVRVA